VGIFDFEEPATDPSDPKAVSAPIRYKCLANKTFPFSKEQV
jgi:hypothetical protein